MFTLNINNDVLYFKDIKRDHLPQILKWYNKVDDFKFATGIDTPISLEVLVRKYAEVVISSDEFFVGIYIKKEDRMIGILKGRHKYKSKDALWISSIVVDPAYQNKGYGTMVIEMLLAYFKKNNGVNSVSLAVIEENIQGRTFWRKLNFIELRKIENHLKLQDRSQNVIIMYRQV